MRQKLINTLWSRRRPARAIGSLLETAQFTVRQGKRYRATITLTFFEQIATNDMISEKLGEVGFKEVKVTGSGGRRLAEALWAKPDTSAPLDNHLSNVTEIA